MPKRIPTFKPKRLVSSATGLTSCARLTGQPRLSATRRGYGKAWRLYRLGFLADHPVCEECGTEATVVDHIVPHKADYELMWDPNNHQALCKPCHDRKTAKEDGGFGRVKHVN